MNNAVEELNALKALTEQIHTDSKAIHDFDGLYIFLSFDVVNSTAFKSLNPYWAKTFSIFRDYTSKYMSESFREKHDVENDELDYCNLKYYSWKNLGDEVIFMFPNPNPSELYKLPNTCWRVLDQVDKSLDTPTEKSPIKVSVKATLWIADIDSKEYLLAKRFEEYNKNKKIEETEPSFSERNINISINDIEHNAIDFLGPDIDTGFRLSHYSNHNKVTIDARLAWILSNIMEKHKRPNYIRNCAKIVSYKKLKGVWNEKPYPIIWYMPEWKNENLFYYDEEIIEDSIAAEIIKKNYNFIDINKLESILSDAKQLDYSNELLKKLESKNGRKIKSLERIFDYNKQIELHLICLCINEFKEVLALKRTNDRVNLPGVIDFGCTYLKQDKTIKESLINGYLSKIGTEIKLGNNELPIRTITIDRADNKIINALIFIGKVKKDKVNIDTKKYSTIFWIPYDTFTNPKKRLNSKLKFVSGFKERFDDIVNFINKE